MIIGNGLMAQAFAHEFTDEPDFIVFASGVSNSQESRPEQFARERALLCDALAQDKFILYFSTCSVSDPELLTSHYVRHKIEMEHLVCSSAPKMAIFRLPQVVGHTPNPNTLTNYLYRQISSGAPFKIWLNARRNLIDVADVASIVTHLVRTQRADGVIANVACPFSVPVIDLVKIFESVLAKRAHYDTVVAGGSYAIDVDLAMAAASQAGIPFDANYVEKLIRKYYA